MITINTIISFINEYYCSQFTPAHEEVYRFVPFEMEEENWFSVQIGLVPSLNRESLSWRWQLPWPLANTKSSVAFHSHLQSSPSGLKVEAAAAGPWGHLCGPECMCADPLVTWIWPMLCVGDWRPEREWTSLSPYFLFLLHKSLENNEPSGNFLNMLWKTEIRDWTQWRLCPFKNAELNAEVPFTC